MAINAIGQQNQIQQPQFSAISAGAQAGAQPALQRAGQQGGSCPMQCCGGATNACSLPKSCGGGSCSPAGAGKCASGGQANATNDIMQMLMSLLQKLGQGAPSAAKV